MLVAGVAVGKAKRKNPRRTNSTRRNDLRARVAAEGLPCHLCGCPIDYTLPHGHPMAYELDEIVPVSRGGSPYDPANVAPAHALCNRRRGAMSVEAYRALYGMGGKPAGLREWGDATSRKWL